MKTLPFLNFWPTKQLNRLQYFLKEEKLIRGQEVYREGQKAKDVYLICEGEFLLTKNVPVQEEQMYKLDKLMGPNQSANQEYLKPEELKVVKSSVADLGPKSAIQANP